MDWDLNFDDILKEYGINPEGEDSSAADAPEPKEQLPEDLYGEFKAEPDPEEPAPEEVLADAVYYYSRSEGFRKILLQNHFHFVGIKG